jgi:hypothetical protein
MFILLKRNPSPRGNVGIILLCSLIAVYASAAFAQSVRFSLPTNATGVAGESITIPLHLDPANHAVGSFDATVEFQNNLLAYTEFSAGPILAAADGWLVDVNGDNAAGTVVIGAFSFGQVTGAGPAIVLKFAVSATAAGGDTAHLLLRGLVATDTNVVQLPVTGVAGKFTVKPAISGRIRTASGIPISGVTITELPGEPMTNAEGYYRAIVDPGWSGAAIPIKRGYTFDPPSHQYAKVSRDQTAQDYLGVEALEEAFAFPNPFNPEIENAQIRFALSEPAKASIKILDGRGDLVQEFASEAPSRANMQQTIRWDGRNRRGERVANGVYFYIIEAPDNDRLSGKIGVVR